jgi:hypothetical protein
MYAVPYLPRTSDDVVDIARVLAGQSDVRHAPKGVLACLQVVETKGARPEGSIFLENQWFVFANPRPAYVFPDGVFVVTWKEPGGFIMILMDRDMTNVNVRNHALHTRNHGHEPVDVLRHLQIRPHISVPDTRLTGSPDAHAELVSPHATYFEFTYDLGGTGYVMGAHVFKKTRAFPSGNPTMCNTHISHRYPLFDAAPKIWECVNHNTHGYNTGDVDHLLRYLEGVVWRIEDFYRGGGTHRGGGELYTERSSRIMYNNNLDDNLDEAETVMPQLRRKLDAVMPRHQPDTGAQSTAPSTAPSMAPSTAPSTPQEAVAAVARAFPKEVARLFSSDPLILVQLIDEDNADDDSGPKYVVDIIGGATVSDDGDGDGDGDSDGEDTAVRAIVRAAGTIGSNTVVGGTIGSSGTIGSGSHTVSSVASIFVLLLVSLAAAVSPP